MPECSGRAWNRTLSFIFSMARDLNSSCSVSSSWSASFRRFRDRVSASVKYSASAFSKSADSIIEKEAFSISQGESVVVVTSDYELQRTTFRPNVIRQSSRQFAEELQEHTKRIAISPECITMSHRIEDRIDPGTVDRLKVLREKLSAPKGDQGEP